MAISEEQRQRDVEELISMLNKMQAQDIANQSKASGGVAAASGGMTAASGGVAASAVNNNNNGFSSGISNSKVQDIEDINSVLSGINNRVHGYSADSAESEASQQLRNARLEKRLQLMSVQELASMGLDDETLGQYFDKFVFRQFIANSFDYGNRDSYSKTSLQEAIKVIGNMHYCCTVRQIYDYDNVMQSLQNQASKNVRFRLEYVIFKAYSTRALNYDELPSMETLKKLLADYIQEYKQVQADEQEYRTNPYLGGNGNNASNVHGFSEDPSDRFTGDFEVKLDEQEQQQLERAKEVQNRNMYNHVSEDNIISNNFMSEVAPGRCLRLEPRQSQSVVLLAPDTYVQTKIDNSASFNRLRKKLFQTARGTEYELKQRWFAVLDAVARLYPNKNMVTRFTIAGNQVIVNGKSIFLDGVLGGDYGIELEDIVRIHETFKKFPKIRILVLDDVATRCAIREYGDTSEAMWKIFQQNSNLQSLGLVDSGDGEAKFYTRQGYREQAEAIDKHIKVQKFKMQCEENAALKNPRLHEKNPGYTHRLFASSKEVSHHFFKTAKKRVMNDKSPQLVRALGWTMAGTGLIVAGAAVGLAGKIFGVAKQVKQGADDI